jgi:hypothetical protein
MTFHWHTPNGFSDFEAELFELASTITVPRSFFLSSVVLLDARLEKLLLPLCDEFEFGIANIEITAVIGCDLITSISGGTTGGSTTGGSTTGGTTVVPPVPVLPPPVLEPGKELEAKEPSGPTE